MDVISYHLYHHMPDPLPPDQLSDARWLCNNAIAYSMVAMIRAVNHATALQTAQCKVREQTLPRFSVIQADELLRETAPGDVLVSARKAWMVQRNGTLHELSYASSQAHRWLKQEKTVTDLAWSPDGTLLLAAEQNKRIVVHDVTRRLAEAQAIQYPASYRRDEYTSDVVAWSPLGERAASGGYHGEVHIWQPIPWRSEAHLGSFLVCCTDEPRGGGEKRQITSLTWSPSGQYIFAGRQDGQVIVWNAENGRRGSVRGGGHSKEVTVLAFAPGQPRTLLSASEDGFLRIWDVQTSEHASQYQHAKGVTAAVWSPDGSVVASTERDDAAIHLWSPETGHLLERLALSISTTHPPTALSLAWSPDGRWLAAGCDDGTLQVFAMRTSQHVLTYRAGSEGAGDIRALAWSPDGEWLASGGNGLYNHPLDTRIWAARQDLEAR